jgi:hypothetical protein
VQSEVLSQVGSRGCLARAAFEIDDADDLQVLAWTTMRKVTATSLGAFVEVRSESLDVFDRVQSPTATSHFWSRALTFEIDPTEITSIHTEQFGDLA